MKPLVIQYTNILHRHGVGSKQAKQFKEQHADGPVFQQRARKLDQIWLLKPPK